MKLTRNPVAIQKAPHGTRLKGIAVAMAVGLMAKFVHAQAPTISVQPTGDSPASVVGLVAGGYQTTMIRQDEKLWTVGNNDYGTLGDGTTASRSIAVAPLGVTGIVTAAAGWRHTLLVTGTGTVYAVGYNGCCQLGDGTRNNSSIPLQVAGLSGVIKAAAGFYYSAVLKSDGTVWSWGYNTDGELGNGTFAMTTTPVIASGLSGVVAIAAGYSHTLALKSDGTVWAWGYNVYGELGDGTTISRATPAQVPGLTGVSAIAAGGNSSYAVRSDGTAWAWGQNPYGQFGDGTSNNRVTPARLGAVTGVQSIAAGYYHMILLKTDGTVWGCGWNAEGELGDGDGWGRNTPVQMVGITGATAIAAGDLYSAVLKSDGTVWSTGYNSSGSVGDGTTTNRLSPVQTLQLGDAIFSVVATGNPTYQWQRQPVGQGTFSNLANNSTYSGVTTPELRVSSPTSAMSGDKFRCVITNSSGTVTTNQVALVLGSPTLSVVGGNNQSAMPSAFNTNPFDVAVWNAAGSAPLMATPLTFTVQSGGGLLATTNMGSPSLFTSLTLSTDVNGTAIVYYRQPATGGVTSQITAASGGTQLTFTTQSIGTTIPPNAPPWAHTSTSTPTSVSFSWGSATPSNGGAAIAGYNIYRNGTLLNGSPQMSTSYTDSTVTAGTSYTYTIKAVDTAGTLSTATSLTVSAPASSTSGTFDVYNPTP